MTTEAQKLEVMTGDEAKAILHQIGWFRTDANYMSLRLSDDQLNQIQQGFIDGLYETPEQMMAGAVGLLVACQNAVESIDEVHILLDEIEGDGPLGTISSILADVQDKSRAAISKATN